ncbi:MAG TPA: GGDEF domain-containing protein, partial [Sphingomicrobium sp.]
MSELSGDVVDVDDRERLIEEISLLRGKVARLQERVEQLDQLAHQDSLIDLPNRRGFMRELERLIARA